MLNLNKIRRVFGLMIFVGLGGMLFFIPADSLAMTISPPVQELVADPGATIRGVVKLFNDENQTKTLYADIQTFTAKGEKGEPGFLEQEIDENMLAHWIKLSSIQVVLEPGQRQEIPYIIQIPPLADPGGHYAVIFWSTQAPAIKGTGVAIASKIGTLVLLRVQGEIIEQGRLLDFSLKDKKKFYAHLPIDFMVYFENSGNTHLKPYGEIKISNLLGRQTDSVKVNIAIDPNGIEAPVGNVLPQTRRMFENSWVKNNSAETAQGFLKTLKYEKDNFAFGRYQALLHLQYGAQAESIQSQLVFWVLPWHLILVVLLGAMVLICASIFCIKKYNQWIVNKAKLGT